MIIFSTKIYNLNHFKISLQVNLSQNGASLLSLHPHKSMSFLTSSIVNLIGLKAVPL